MKRKLVLMAILFISCSLDAMQERNEAIDSLRELCIQKILKESYDYDSLPSLIGDEISARERKMTHNLVLKCIYGDQVSQIQTLLDQGANPNYEHFMTPLDYATQYSEDDRARVEITHLLINAGARFTLTSMFNAIKSPNQEIFLLLKERFFPEYWGKVFRNKNGGYRLCTVRNKNDWRALTDEEGNNAFHICARHLYNVEFADWFLNNFAESKYLYVRNNEGDTVLDLLQRGADTEREREIANRFINSARSSWYVEWIGDKFLDGYEYIRTREDVNNLNKLISFLKDLRLHG